MIPRMAGRSEGAQRHALTPAQWSIYEAGWDETARFRVAVCGRRFGKALALETPLASPDGWTSIGQVRIGDRLYDERGRICRVMFATEVMFGQPCNRVLFDDGSLVVADDDHLWSVSDTAETGSLLLTTWQIRVGLQDDRHFRIPSCRSLNNDGRKVALRRRQVLCRLRQRYGHKDDNGTWRISGLGRRAYILRDLLLSIGLVPTMAMQDGRWTISWRVGRTDRWRSIVAVEPISSHAVRCIQVDSQSRLFLCTRSLIPTHNTFLMAEELRRAARLAIRRNIGVENEIWYGAPNFLQAKRVMWSRLKRALPLAWLDGKPNETSCMIRIRSGHVIRLVGLDAAENLRGSGLWFFGGDEWADCRPTAWQEVIRPMLSTSRGHALFIGTPKGFDHFRDAYLLGQPDGDPSYRSFMFTTADGGNVPLAEIAAAEQELDPRSFRQEYKASFENYAGRVLYAFSRVDNVKRTDHDRTRAVHVGIDFNINPMSATIWQEAAGTVSQIDEIVMPTSNTDEMAEEIARRFGRDGFEPGQRVVDHIIVYPDPAGAQRRTSAGGRTDVGILKQRGFRVSVQRSHPPVRDRMNVMNRCFRSADDKIIATVDPRCVKSIEAYERLVFRDGTAEPDKSQGFDHLVDATGYYLFGRFGTSSATTNVNSFMER